MGAFWSLLMATMVRAPFIPTTCWIAPLMPSARYSFGATVWPELPICRSIGSQPSSQIGRDAAISPPSAFASASACGIFSGALMPRPIATISGACVKSTADFASLKRSSGLVRICAALNDTATEFTGAFPEGCAAIADAIANHAFAEHGSELRREVAHLVRVWKQNQIRLGAFDDLFQRDAK